MLRFFHVIIWNLFRGPFMIPLMQHFADHPDRYSDEFRYRFARYAIRIMMRTGLICPVVIGKENLPQEGGYVMYPNHEGRFDALGILATHDRPCSVIIRDDRSHGMLARQFLAMIQGKRILPDNFKQVLSLFNELSREIMDGKKYILFPEGGYYKGKQNQVIAFKPGSFKLAMKAHAPIVPVALIDSYKVFEGKGLFPVHPKICYLEPIPYEEYRTLRTSQIAELVRARIEEAIRKESSSRKRKLPRTPRTCF